VARKRELTTADLVVLSLLVEQPMHGYQANLELERREVQDWAGVSRPQVYYSLEKLNRLGFIHETGDPEPNLGPERRIYSTTAKGRTALLAALERDAWTSQRDRPAFLTWMALSWQIQPEVFRQQVKRRREFLERELAKEKVTLRAIKKDAGHTQRQAIWMVSLVIEQFQLELRWLEKVARESPKPKPLKRRA
jgi:DNA-binding PadR family transcriptional regulator